MIRIAGVDEAGRGPLAGPVVAAAVVFDEGYTSREIRDSKKLTRKKREELYQKIVKDAVAWSVVAVGHRRIDKLNILNASLLAMAYAALRVKPDLVLVDGPHRLPIQVKQEAIIDGDEKEVSIAAASILAKVYRDKLMTILDARYPGYGFAKNFGYPTKEHKETILRLGPSPIHRKSFAGVKGLLNQPAITSL